MLQCLSLILFGLILSFGSAPAKEAWNLNYLRTHKTLPQLSGGVASRGQEGVTYFVTQSGPLQVLEQRELGKTITTTKLERSAPKGYRLKDFGPGPCEDGSPCLYLRYLSPAQIQLIIVVREENWQETQRYFLSFPSDYHRHQDHMAVHPGGDIFLVEESGTHQVWRISRQMRENTKYLSGQTYVAEKFTQLKLILPTNKASHGTITALDFSFTGQRFALAYAQSIWEIELDLANFKASPSTQLQGKQLAQNLPSKMTSISYADEDQAMLVKLEQKAQNAKLLKLERR